MNTFARTKKNIKNAKISVFHNKQSTKLKIPLKVVIPIINSIVEPNGSSCAKGNKSCSVGFTYKIVSLKKFSKRHFRYCSAQYNYKWKTATFSKSQLIGAIVTIESNRYRIVDKY